MRALAALAIGDVARGTRPQAQHPRPITGETMRVVRERPDSRRSYAIQAPLFVSVGSGPMQRAVEWSHLGIVLREGDVTGDPHDVRLHLDFQGFEITVPVQLAPSTDLESVTPAGCVRFDFVELSQRSAELIEHFVENLVRGRITSADETLLCIDTPIDPISTKPEQHEVALPTNNL